jgi:uncharacterized membrane protein YfcA
LDTLYVDFPVSGVHTWVFLPPLVAFAVSFFSSMGGVSGAFFLLPYQVSVLNFVSPSVTSTNFVYNIVAIPSGIYRYIREKRMAWPLAWAIVAGTFPGVLLGYYIRVLFLPDPRVFRLFIGCVLLYIACHLMYETFRRSRRNGIRIKSPESGFIKKPKIQGKGSMGRDSARIAANAVVRSGSLSIRKIEYTFGEETYSIGTPRILSMAFIVGAVGGAYGIGGGSILSPFLVAVFNLPVYTVAGAALLGTFMTSIAGVIFYSVIPAHTGMTTTPDWLLGVLFGLGGFLGMYCGARLQKFVPQAYIKAMLVLIMLFLACSYILKYFTG